MTILVVGSNLFFIRKCKEDFCKLLAEIVLMLTLSVKTSRDHPLPPPSPLRSPVSSFLLSCQIKFDRHDLTGQVKPDGTLVGSCILSWNGVGVQVLRNDYLLVVEED